VTRSVLASSLALVLALSASACAESETAIEETEAVTAGGEAQPAAGSEAGDNKPSASQIAAANAPDSAWRTVDPENLLKIATPIGDIWVEMIPEFAPNHVDRMRLLARDGWYDYKVWHRVIDEFMAQGGGALDNPSASPSTSPMQAEFQIRRNPYEMEVEEISERQVNPRSNRTVQPAGYWNGFVVGTQPAAAAAIMGDGLVDSWLPHCPGVAAMARTSDPNSANGQFYIVRYEAEHLNTEYTVWGQTRVGLDVVRNIEEGTLGQGFGFSPTFIEAIDVASDLDDAPTVQVMDTSSPAFSAYLDSLRSADGALPDLCDIEVPARVIN
jgi:peptidylprolyl isomerase